MKRYVLSGDIKHPGMIEVYADTLDEAIDKAEKGSFTVVDEQNKHLSFVFDGDVVEGDEDEEEEAA